jgi:hypothetical protein
MFGAVGGQCVVNRNSCRPTSALPRKDLESWPTVLYDLLAKPPMLSPKATETTAAGVQGCPKLSLS